MGDSRRVRAVRLDARRPGHRHLGRGQDLESQREWQRRRGPTDTQIPFTARVEQTINDALRFPQKVHAYEFPVRMLRDVTTSPDGKVVAYSALGKIYVKECRAGRRAVPAEARYGFRLDDPTRPFRPTDRDRLCGLERPRSRTHPGRAPRRLGRSDIISTPGHYTEPSFSPDGKQIVYRKVAPDDIRGITHGTDPGIYVAAADGTANRRWFGRRDRPAVRSHRQADLFRERRGEKFVLASLEVDGSDEIVHLQSDNATQIEPSPDGSTVAFAERWHAFIAAFPRSGRAIDLGPKSRPFL